MGRAFVGDGLATMLSGSVGGSGVTTYAENIGVMAVTKVYSTLVFVAAALIAMLLGFSPKFGALIHTIPAPVIGGASIVVFGLIAVAGARIWVQNRVDLSQNSNLIMVSVTLVLGAGDFALSLGGFTLGGIGTATFGAILLHALLHRGTREAKEAGGNAGVSHISAALAQGAVWAGWCDPVGRIRHLCRHPAPPRARNLTARRRCACRAWRLPRPSGNVSAILRPSAPAVSATMVNKLTTGRTNAGRVRRSRHPA